MSGCVGARANTDIGFSEFYRPGVLLAQSVDTFSTTHECYPIGQSKGISSVKIIYHHLFPHGEHKAYDDYIEHDEHWLTQITHVCHSNLCCIILTAF